MNRMILCVLAAALLIGILPCAPCPGQLSVGDYVAPVSSGNSIVGITPGGTVKTLFAMPFPVTALTMATDNVDMAVLGWDSTSSMAILATVTPTGTVSTVAKFSSYIYENLTVDPAGFYMVPIGAGGIFVLRIDRFGTVTTISPKPAVGKGKPRGIAVDIGSGGYVVGEIPNLYLIAPDGSSKTIHTNVSINNSIDIMSDARTGTAVIAQQNSLVSVDTVSGVMTTLRGGFNGCFPGLAYDRVRDEWVLAGSCANTNFNVYRVDRSGALNTVTNLVGAGDIEVYGSRHIIAAGDPTPGSTLSMRFKEPGSPGALYLAAASLSTNPGIPTPAGIVDLTPDQLFYLSQVAPTLFVNFMGVLDTNGSAVASVVVPAIAQLRGLRFYVSFVAIKVTTISAIANTAGFTIK